MRPHDLARIPQRLLRPDGAVRVVVLVFLEVRGHVGADLLLELEVVVRHAVLVEAFVQHPQRVREVADEFRLRVVVLVDLGRQEVGVQYLLVAVRVPQLRVVLDHVEAERDDEVGIVDGQRDAVLRAQADRVQAVIRIHVDTALRHERRYDTDACLVAQRSELLARAAADAAVAGDDDRALRGLQHVERSVDDLVVGHGTPEALRRQRLRLRLVLCDVLRQLDVHGAGLLGPREPHGLPDDLRDGLGIQYRRRPLGHRREHADDVHDLVRFLVQAIGRALPGQHEHRRAVHVRVGDAGDQVRRAGTQRAQCAGRVAGQPAVDLGHERGALLVARQDELDLVRFLERHHEVGVLLAGDAEDVFDAFFLETLDEQVGCFHGFSRITVITDFATDY